MLWAFLPPLRLAIAAAPEEIFFSVCECEVGAEPSRRGFEAENRPSALSDTKTGGVPQHCVWTPEISANINGNAAQISSYFIRATTARTKTRGALIDVGRVPGSWRRNTPWFFHFRLSVTLLWGIEKFKVHRICFLLFNKVLFWKYIKHSVSFVFTALSPQLPIPTWPNILCSWHQTGIQPKYTTLKYKQRSSENISASHGILAKASLALAMDAYSP